MGDLAAAWELDRLPAVRQPRALLTAIAAKSASCPVIFRAQTETPAKTAKAPAAVVTKSEIPAKSAMSPACHCLRAVRENA